jgi:hypothetical protein
MTVRAIILTATLFSVAGWAQTGAGVVRGAVQDASKAIVPGAKTRLRNLDTNIARDATGSADGIYYFGGIEPGRYELAVEANGFKKWVGTLEVEVGQTVVIDPALEVGSIASTVEVTGAAPVITTETTELADVKDSLQIHQLPLNGRDITNLFNLTPGVEGGGTPRVNGSKVGSVEMLQDGISMVDRFGGGIQRVRPGLDTVQEFRIETAGSSARYSHPATVQVVTKSGTNALHGSLFETFRDNADGLRARQRQDGATSAKLIRNEYGGSAGGPVYVPRIFNGKDKSFWFFSYEGQRLRQATFDQDKVPTPAMWNGDFTQVIDNNGRRSTIYDPLTTDAQGLRTPFAGNIIPQNRFSPFFKTMQSISHLPTNPVNPFQDFNMLTFYPNQTDTGTWTAKGDQRFSSSDTLSGRFTHSRLFGSQAGGRFGSPAEGLVGAFGTQRQNTTIYSVSIAETHTFAPNFLSELLLAATRNPNGQGTLADFTPWAQRLGLPNPFGLNGWPTITAGSDPWSWDSDNHKDQNLTAYQIEDNLTWVKGKHSIQFGGSIRREENNVRELQQAQGSDTFGGDWTSQFDPVGNQAVSFTGVGLASMALGLPTFLSNQYNRGYFYFQQYNAALYVQDNWKVTRRLSLNLGVRWEKWTPYHEKLNRLVNVDLNTVANTFQVITPGSVTLDSLRGVPPSLLTSWANRGLTWVTADQTHFPSSLVPAANADFGPRLGMAYKLNDKTVLRGSYGRFFWTMPLSQILQSSRTNPPLNLRYTNQLSNADGTGTAAIRNAPQPNSYVGVATVDTNGVVTLPVTAQAFNPWDVRNWGDDTLQTWHVTLEREIMKNTVVKLHYIGDHGSNLEQRFALNTPEAQYNYITRTGNTVPARLDLLRVNPNWNFDAVNHSGYSNTTSFQAEVQRRYASGLAFQWFYTFTHSLTTTDAGGSTAGTGTINDVAGVPSVPENIQIAGEPSLSYAQRLRLVYYNSTAIPSHHIRYNAIYDLPFGRGKRFGGQVSRGLNQLIGGWQLATIGDWRGGTWLSVNPAEYMFGNPSLSGDKQLVFTYNGRQQRLWFRGDFDPTKATNVDLQQLEALVAVNQGDRIVRKLGPAFDNRLPLTLANGTTRLTAITDTVSWNSRAFFHGPGAWNVDSSLFKNFSIAEKTQLRFTADFFNMFNHPNNQNPNNTTGLQDLSVQTNEPRIIQFSLRLQW